MAGAAENTTFKNAVGGHEVELMENYPDALNCVICSLIINKATHGCERHVFCEGCIQEYLTKSFEKECPICPGGCRKQINQAKLSPNFTIDMMINKLKSKCSFKNCSWTGDLLDLVQDHRRQCSYATIKCLRNGCGESFLKEDTEKHDNICLYKYLQCCYCENDVLRMNKDDHEKLCAMEKVKCIHHEVGCNTVMYRQDVTEHEQNNAQENVDLKENLNFVIEKSTTKMNQLKKQNNELKKELFQLKKEVKPVLTNINGQKHTNRLNRILTYIKEQKHTNRLNRIAKIKKKLQKGGFIPNFIEIGDRRLIIKLKEMCRSYCVDVQQLLELIITPNYEKNHQKCFLNTHDFKHCFQEIFKIIPCHWFDFNDIVLDNTQHIIPCHWFDDNNVFLYKTQHIITFPIKNNQIEDFCCKYNAFTVQSINNVMTVTGFPKENKIRIVIDGEERDIEAKEEFNPFDTNKLKAAKVSGSGCIIVM